MAHRPAEQTPLSALAAAMVLVVLPAHRLVGEDTVATRLQEACPSPPPPPFVPLLLPPL